MTRVIITSYYKIKPEQGDLPKGAPEGEIPSVAEGQPTGIPPTKANQPPEVPVPGSEDNNPDEMKRRSELAKAAFPVVDPEAAKPPRGEPQEDSQPVSSQTAGDGYPELPRSAEPKTFVKDPDKAHEMAKAGDVPESEAAYLRQNAKLAEEKWKSNWTAGIIKEYEAKRDELAGRYQKSTRDQMTHHWKTADSVSLREEAQEVKTEAERLEFWAGEIYDHKDLAGELTPQKCVNIENWIERNSYRPEEIDWDLERLKALDQEGRLSVAIVVQEVADYFGRGNKDIPNRFRELTSNNATTVGEIKEFLFDEMGKAADEWRDVIDENRQKLLVIQGK